MTPLERVREMTAKFRETTGLNLRHQCRFRVSSFDTLHRIVEESGFKLFEEPNRERQCLFDIVVVVDPLLPNGSIVNNRQLKQAAL